MKKLMKLIFLTIFILTLTKLSGKDLNENMVILDYPIMMADSIINKPEIILKILKDTNNLLDNKNMLSKEDYQFEIIKYIKENYYNAKCQRTIQLNTIIESNKIIYYSLSITYRNSNGEFIIIKMVKNLKSNLKNWKLQFIQIGDPPHVPPLEFEKKE